MNIFTELHANLIAAVEQCQQQYGWPKSLPANYRFEVPRDLARADIATSLALQTAKRLGKPPAEAAKQLAAALSQQQRFAAVSAHPSGFVNLQLAASDWRKLILAILHQQTNYGSSQANSDLAANVEFVSANPTGPLHLANVRGAIIGDVIAAVLQFTGATVVREYYVNDAGGQIDKLAESVWQRMRELSGHSFNPVAGGYAGTYLIPVAKQLLAQYRNQFSNLLDRDDIAAVDEGKWFQLIARAAVKLLLQQIKTDLENLHVVMDRYSSEFELQQSPAITAVIAKLQAAEYIYRGTLPPPAGQQQADWQEREQLLFKASAFGDDRDRPLQKADGKWTYFASDIAYHYDKFNRLPALPRRQLIDVVGADHAGYITRIGAASRLAAQQQLEFSTIICQTVRLVEDGDVRKMSKRSGQMITVAELLTKLDADLIRFHVLTRQANAPLDIDVAKLLATSRDNPVYYVQYAHARIKSLQQRAKTAMQKVVAAPDRIRYELLQHPGEIRLLQLCAQWPRMVHQAATKLEPHRIAGFLSQLAAQWHQTWAMARSNPQLRFIINGDPELTAARLALSEVVRLTLCSGLQLMQVAPKDRLDDAESEDSAEKSAG